MQKSFQTINIPKLPVFTTEEGIKQINNNLKKLKIGKILVNLFQNFSIKKK